MCDLFCTELSSARELNKRKECTEIPLPSIPQKTKINQPKFHLNLKPNISPKKKTITVRKASQRNKRTKLSKITEFVITHPTKIPSNINEIELVESQLTSLLQEYIDNGDYDNSSEIQRVLNSVKQKKNFINKNENTLPLERQELKKQELGFLVSEYVEHWDKILDRFMEITRQQATKIAENHQEELDTFDMCIPTDLTAEFRKHSVALLEKRELEKRSAQIQDYQRAIIVQREADRLEKEESKIQMEKMREHFMNKRTLLTNKHRYQMSVFFEHAEATRSKIIYMRNQLINGYLNRMRQIDENIANICRENDMEKERIPRTAISKERKAIVKKADRTPIPKCRPGTSFIRARSKLVHV